MTTLLITGQTPTAPVETTSAPVEDEQANPENSLTRPPEQAAAFYDAFVLPRLSLSTLGLALPRNDGDTAALLSFHSLTLEKTIGETRQNEAEVRGEKVRTGMTNANAFFLSMTQHSEDLEKLSGQRKEKEGEKTQKSNLRTDRESQKSELESEKAAKQIELSHLEAQDPSELDSSEIASLEADIASLEADIASLEADIDSLTGQIATLTGEIEQLTQETDELIAEEAAKVSSYMALQQLTFFFLFNHIIAPKAALDDGRDQTFGADLLRELQFEEIADILVISGVSDSDVQEIREFVNRSNLEAVLVDRLVAAALAILVVSRDAQTLLSGLPDIGPIDPELVARDNKSRLQISI